MPVPSDPIAQSSDQSPTAYTGQGWAFPLQVTPQGGIQLSSGERSIEESIWIILRTELGERVQRSPFGSRLPDLAFAPLNLQTLLLLRLRVEEALRAWEPRIELEEVRADPDPIREKVDIIINYQIVNTPVQRSLVYPFYLSQAQA
jgi:uncharacterized protein